MKPECSRMFLEVPGSPLMRGAWIETMFVPRKPVRRWSPLMRGAWIETALGASHAREDSVAPHARGVD